MPTPTRIFAELAAKYGDVDPEDVNAVHTWYETTLPTLSPPLIEEILDELLGNEQLEIDPELPKSYPEVEPLPTLDQAPPVRVPLLTAGWRDLLRKLLTRHPSSGADD